MGLGIDESNDELLGALSVLAEARRDRNSRIVELFKSDGVSLDLDEIKEIAGTERIGRPHLAEALLRRKIVKSKQEAFDRFLGKGKPFYLPKDCFSLSEAQGLIKAAGGISVIAHPYSLFVSKPKLAALMDGWKEAGVEGVEAYHPTAKLGQCRILETMARRGASSHRRLGLPQQGKTGMRAGKNGGGNADRRQLLRGAFPIAAVAFALDLIDLIVELDRGEKYYEDERPQDEPVEAEDVEPADDREEYQQGMDPQLVASTIGLKLSREIKKAERAKKAGPADIPRHADETRGNPDQRVPTIGMKEAMAVRVARTREFFIPKSEERTNIAKAW